MIGSIHHYGVNVADMDRALRFYCDTLGFEERSHFRSRINTAVLNDLDVDEAVTNIAFLVGNGVQIELLEYIQPKGTNEIRKIANNEAGITHICFEVDDCTAIYERLSDDVEFLSAPQTVSNEDVTTVKCYDPDGNILEFLEHPDDWSMP